MTNIPKNRGEADAELDRVRNLLTDKKPEIS